MKGYTIVASILMGMLLSCSDGADSVTPEINNETNNKLATVVQGDWIRIVDENSRSFHQINLKFDGTSLFWSDSLVNNQGKYAIIRNGSCVVKYLKNDPEVVKKYLMGRPPLTAGVKDILVSEWRGTKALNRNYRNVNDQKGWELINEWESGNAQPPFPDAVYALLLDPQRVQLEYDGQEEDFLEIYSRPQ